MGKNIKNISGFTLLELLIAMGIFMLVLLPVLNVFDNSYESYIVQDDVASTQQNLRTAMLFLKRDIRMAGAGLEGLTVPGDLGDLMSQMGGMLGDGGEVYGLGFKNASNITVGSDELLICYQDPVLGSCADSAWENMSEASRPPLCSELPNVTVSDNMPTTSTVANVLQTLADEPWNAWNEDCYCGGTTYTQPKPEMMALVTSPDGKMANLLFVTGTNTNKNNQVLNGPVQLDKVPGLDNFTNVPSGQYKNKLLNIYPSGSTLSFFSFDFFIAVRYFLGGPNNDILYRQVGDATPQALADGIEDFQFALFGDFTPDDGDPIPDMETDCASNPDCINDTDLIGDDADTSDDDLINKVRVVRISILARTAHEHRDLPGQVRPQIEDHKASTAKDNFRRRLLQVEVQARNLALYDTEE